MIYEPQLPARLGTPSNPVTSISVDASSTDTSLFFNQGLVDLNGTKLTTPFTIAVRKTTGAVENIKIVTLSTDGLNATNCIRGLDKTGTDTDTSNPTLAMDLSSGDVVETVQAVQTLTQLDEVATGSRATGGNNFIIGDGGNDNKTFSYRDSDGVEGVFRINKTTGKAQAKNKGGSFYDIDTGAGHGTTSNISAHAQVDSSADTPVDNMILEGDTASGEWIGNTTENANVCVKTPSVYTPAFLTGGTSATTDIPTWIAISNATFRITIDGVQRDVTANPSTLDGSATMNDVSALLQSALRTQTGGLETIVWSTNKFIISSADTTSSSSITVTSATGAGTDISGAGATDFLDCDSGNGVVTPKSINLTGYENKIVILESDGQINENLLPISDEPYDATAWNGDNDAATKNVIRDKIESLGADKRNRLIYSNSTSVTVNDTTPVDFIPAFSIPGGTLVTSRNNIIKITLKVGITIEAGVGASLKLDYGSETHTLSMVNSGGSDVTSVGGYAYIYIYADGTSAQEVFSSVECFQGRISTTPGSTVYTANSDSFTVDSSSDQDLRVYGTAASAARSTITVAYSHVEVLSNV